MKKFFWIFNIFLILLSLWFFSSFTFFNNYNKKFNQNNYFNSQKELGKNLIKNQFIQNEETFYWQNWDKTWTDLSGVRRDFGNIIIKSNDDNFGYTNNSITLHFSGYTPISFPGYENRLVDNIIIKDDMNGERESFDNLGFYYYSFIEKLKKDYDKYTNPYFWIKIKIKGGFHRQICNAFMCWDRDKEWWRKAVGEISDFGYFDIKAKGVFEFNLLNLPSDFCFNYRTGKEIGVSENAEGYDISPYAIGNEKDGYQWTKLIFYDRFQGHYKYNLIWSQKSFQDNYQKFKSALEKKLLFRATIFIFSTPQNKNYVFNQVFCLLGKFSYF